MWISGNFLELHGGRFSRNLQFFGQGWRGAQCVRRRHWLGGLPERPGGAFRHYLRSGSWFFFFVFYFVHLFLSLSLTFCFGVVFLALFFVRCDANWVELARTVFVISEGTEESGSGQARLLCRLFFRVSLKGQPTFLHLSTCWDSSHEPLKNQLWFICSICRCVWFMWFRESRECDFVWFLWFLWFSESRRCDFVWFLWFGAKITKIPARNHKNHKNHVSSDEPLKNQFNRDSKFNCLIN